MNVGKRQVASTCALDKRSSSRIARIGAVTVEHTAPVNETLVVDDLTFEIHRSDRRRTLGLTVERDGQLVISAPIACRSDVLEGFVREKRFWLYTKLAKKEALLEEAVRPRQFVSGESFPYLGRSYRLLLVDEQDVPLKLERGRFVLRRSDAVEGRAAFIGWYGARARPWLEQRLSRFVSRVGISPARIEVRDLGFRWGSCGRKGRISFHWATVLMPPALIDYVIVHELVHLLEPKHTPEFWLAVERTMPDFESRRARIAELGYACASIV
jgi:predicted metal-dependent hydrolase